MKKVILFLALVFFWELNSIGQTVTVKDIIGEWISTSAPKGESFGLKFEKKNIVQIKMGPNKTIQKYSIDTSSNLIQIETKNEIDEKMMILIKYENNNQLKVQISHSPKILKNWNIRETKNNTAYLIRK
jgi:hypothetical protein